MHLFLPEYFPLIDNPIARELKLFKQDSKITKKINKYQEFTKTLNDWLEENDISTIAYVEINDLKIYPYKTIDEYLFLSISKEKAEALKSLKEFINENCSDFKISECLDHLEALKAKLSNI